MAKIENVSLGKANPENDRLEDDCLLGCCAV
jgi:hypothetical protein